MYIAGLRAYEGAYREWHFSVWASTDSLCLLAEARHIVENGKQNALGLGLRV